MKRIWLLFILFLLSANCGFAQTSGAVTTVSSSLAPVFREPSEASEQVTQVLFGDHVRVLDSQGGWVKVLVPDQYRTPEGYPGWMRVKFLQKIPSKVAGTTVTVAYPAVSLRAAPSVEAAAREEVYLASRLEIDEPRSRVSEGEKWYEVQRADGPLWVRASQVTTEKPLAPGQGDIVVELAKKFKGTPYLWGGMTRKGIDCSGLMYTCYRVHGFTLPRDADQQFLVGRGVDENDLAPGDMVFFGKAADDITHVGMYAGDGMMVHASSGRGVVVNRLFEGWYLQHYQGARRVLTTPRTEPVVLQP